MPQKERGKFKINTSYADLLPSGDEKDESMEKEIKNVFTMNVR
jgi:hypothetical protein